jgi:H-type lectin domain
VKVFVPGEIARAEDVNSNFAELKQLIDRLISSRQQGRVSLGQYAPNEGYEAKVSFAQPFRKVPNIAISCANQRLRIAIYNVTATGFTYYGWNDTGFPNASDAYFDWVATIDEFKN